ncbi:MAG: leucyl/phenylalanyl-tRNA--protein transferase, partial [Bacteroidales bacterium]|nr:leucyl/phenylalanyl-tRNA--protein transferase [Bacteroidales bacterium]
STERLLRAYSLGIFPWYSEDDPIMWWSPNPRMVIKPSDFKASKSLRKLLRDANYQVKIDYNFEEVISACASNPRKDQDGTWITNELKAALIRLHQLGFAHSFEIYTDKELVGGLYGLSLGKVFFGESMFHKVSNASKLAFYELTKFLKQHDFELIDAQQETAHLKSLGAYPVDRTYFLSLLEEYISAPTLRGNWGNGGAAYQAINFEAF